MTSGQPRPRRTAAGWWTGYRRAWLRGDLPGALTAWALIVPESVACAEIAGVSPQNAFHGAPVALALHGLPGGSRFLVVGATSAAAVLPASTVAAFAPDKGESPAGPVSRPDPTPVPALPVRTLTHPKPDGSPGIDLHLDPARCPGTLLDNRLLRAQTNAMAVEQRSGLVVPNSGHCIREEESFLGT
ncbi:hypothetical protein LO771_08260 [Streptacidiphilus sp. ASG 303]|uniref:SulP family inorganic anion transporter n=1 Tax=Streptacidiphilus sp. ASG 303 TaxID=2896847 RepID=UPI001E4BB0EC|nr:SulP family inorganic anion transporter [Streptacidiphilus sp. ASG 303]MCD0482396.1 hypothetical protein [Streptacidiphilus sp. ASG 303]